MIARPSSASAAPRMKSIWPPTPLYIRWPIESAQTWPVRSTSIAELIAVIRLKLRMTWVSLVKSVGRISTIGLSSTKPVELGRAHHERGHDLAPVALLGPSGDHSRLDEVDDDVGHHLGVDAEVLLVVEGHARPRPGWRRSPSGSWPCRGPARRRTPRSAARSAPISGSACGVGRDVDLDREVDLVDVDEALAERPRHRPVELGDDDVGRPDRRLHRLDRRAQRAVAVGVRWGHVDEHGVERQEPAREQVRHVRQEDRDVLGPALGDRRPGVRADEQRPVAEVAGHLRAEERAGSLGVEVDDLDVLRARAPARPRASRRTDGVAAAHWT